MQMTFGEMKKTINQPMKGPTEPITNEDLEAMQYPLIVSPKLDGIRAIISNGIVYSASMKEIPNHHIQRCLRDMEGHDGELIVGDPTDPDCFNKTTGAVRSKSGRPDFTFYVFDTFTNMDEPYTNRIPKEPTNKYVKLLEYELLHTPQLVYNYEENMVKMGYEGIMIRNPNAPYKDGRTTLLEQNIFKRKPVLDDEAIIIGFEEQMSIHGEPKNTLGKFILRNDKWTFHCGTGQGLTQELRQHIWDHQEEYMGKIVTYKYQGYGSRDLPRLPIFKGFREKFDLTQK